MMCLHVGFREQPWVSTLSFCCGFLQTESRSSSLHGDHFYPLSHRPVIYSLRNPSKKNKQTKNFGYKGLSL